MSQQAIAARRLLNNQSVGVLATHSIDVEGYPFGSITPYIVGYDGQPAILISTIAQHTRNIKHNNKVSLTIFDARHPEPQSAARLTWLGDAELRAADDQTTRSRYLRYFPSAQSYFDTHDFDFYCIRLRRGRFIGGFGEIHWLEPNDLLIENPFGAGESRIIDHMNADHQPALHNYARLLGSENVKEIAMTGIDSEGFDLMVDGIKRRFQLENPIHTAEQARAELVRLARLQV